MTVHAYECARELQAHSYACTARLIRGDGSVACTCALREQTACIRRYFACASDSAGVHMNTRTQSACAAHIRTAVVRACIATCSKRCTIYNMALSYSCHSILLAYTNRVQCSGHNCAHAGVPLGARRVLCCIGGCATLKYLLAFPLACMELYLRCLCVGVLPPPYTLQGMDTWLRGIPRACVAMRPSVLCYVCDRVHVSVFAYRGCDGLAPLTIGGADQALAVAVWIYTTWYLLDDGVFAGCVGTWVYRYTLVQHRSIFATKAV